MNGDLGTIHDFVMLNAIAASALPLIERPDSSLFERKVA
jgi:hypothetical protein